MEKAQDLIMVIAKALVDFPEQVSISVIDGNETIVFELKVAQPDMGKIIGKQGKNADAIRALLNAIGGRMRKRLILEIVDQERPHALQRH